MPHAGDLICLQGILDNYLWYPLISLLVHHLHTIFASCCKTLEVLKNYYNCFSFDNHWILSWVWLSVARLFTPEIAAFYEGYYKNKGVQFIKGTVMSSFESDSQGKVSSELSLTHLVAF
jgi:hypothetical protein